MFRKCMWLICGMGLCGLLAGQAVAADQEPFVHYPFDQLGASVVDASGNGMDSRIFEDMTIHSIFGY